MLTNILIKLLPQAQHPHSHKVIPQLKARTAFFDPITTKLFKSVSHCFINHLVNINDTFIQLSPFFLKHAVITAQLKKNNLDQLVINNHRPIYTPQFLSKIFEEMIYRQLNEYLYSQGLYDKYQSGLGPITAQKQLLQTYQ